MSYYRLLSFCVLELLLVFQMSAAMAINTPSELIGVWRGTLGKSQIVACWDEDFGGGYYTLQNPLRVALYQEENGNTWLENERERLNETTIIWKLKQPVGEYIQGIQESSPQGSVVPIRLTRIKRLKKETDYSSDCLFESELYNSFNAPRVNHTHIHVGIVKKFMGKAYRDIYALDRNVVSVKLMGEKAPNIQVNRILRKNFMADIALYLSCEVNEAISQGYYHSRVQLRFWSNQWLSWSSHVEGYCGGAHPFFGTSTTTIDLHSAKEVNLWNWFRLVKRQGYNSEQSEDSYQVCEFLEDRCLPEKLAKRVRKAKPSYEDKSCKGIDFHGNIDEIHGGYFIALNEKGVAFIPSMVEPARATRSCYGHYTIPFAALAPYLNQSGMAAVNDILMSLTLSNK